MNDTRNTDSPGPNVLTSKLLGFLTVTLLLAAALVGAGLVLGFSTGNLNINVNLYTPTPKVCSKTPGGIQYCYHDESPDFRKADFRLRLTEPGASFDTQQDRLHPLMLAIRKIPGVKMAFISEGYGLAVEKAQPYDSKEVWPKIEQAVDQWKADGEPSVPFIPQNGNQKPASHLSDSNPFYVP